MRHLVQLAACAALLTATTASAVRAACAPGQGLGVARIVEVDATGGPVFGSITKREREQSFLARKEAVLTFDDGPMPGITRSILDTLDRFCTKATFFSVGKMAVAYPETVREILRRGHTLGTHTWSHPMSLPRIGLERARDQIESGFAAVALAAGEPIAPFFRFPGLNDSDALVAHLEQRGIATFTVDVVSNDSYIASSERLIEKTLARLDTEGGGIMLFHDIKPQTARALPTILAEMKARGYAIVHLVAKAPFVPDPAYTVSVRSHVAERRPAAARSLLAVARNDQPAPAVPRSLSADEPRLAPEPVRTAEADLPPAQRQPGPVVAASAPPAPIVVAGPLVAADPPAPEATDEGLPRLQFRRRTQRLEPAVAARADAERADAERADAERTEPPVHPRAAEPAAAAAPTPAPPDARTVTTAATPPAPPAPPRSPVTRSSPSAGDNLAEQAGSQPPSAAVAAPAPGEEPAASPPQPQVVAGDYGPAASRRKPPVPQGRVQGKRDWRASYADRIAETGN